MLTEALSRNERESHELAVTGSVVADVVRKFVSHHTQWEGGWTDLLNELNKFVEDGTKHRESWPRDARTLSNKLRERAPSLRASGIDVEFLDKDRPKYLKLRDTRCDSSTQKNEGSDAVGESYLSKGEIPCYGGGPSVAVPTDAVRGVFDDYIALLHVRGDNERLRERVAELEEANLQYREALVAGEHLQQIASMRDDFEIPMLPSEVVGLDVKPFFRSVLMDRGGAHGVRAGYPVITAEGVVGLVTATSAHAAKTMLLLDRQSAIDGIVQRSRARGIARGGGTDEMEFEFVVRGGDVVPGDIVITSGLGGVYPKGLKLGTIESLSDAGGHLLRDPVGWHLR